MWDIVPLVEMSSVFMFHFHYSWDEENSVLCIFWAYQSLFIFQAFVLGFFFIVLFFSMSVSSVNSHFCSLPLASTKMACGYLLSVSWLYFVNRWSEEIQERKDESFEKIKKLLFPSVCKRDTYFFNSQLKFKLVDLPNCQLGVTLNCWSCV